MRETWLAWRGRFPGGQHDPNWKGSMIELQELRAVADEVGMAIERVVGEGTQYCCVLTRRQ
jgi:hypothetical protein